MKKNRKRSKDKKQDLGFQYVFPTLKVMQLSTLSIDPHSQTFHKWTMSRVKVWIQHIVIHQTSYTEKEEIITITWSTCYTIHYQGGWQNVLHNTIYSTYTTITQLHIQYAWGTQVRLACACLHSTYNLYFTLVDWINCSLHRVCYYM